MVVLGGGALSYELGNPMVLERASGERQVRLFVCHRSFLPFCGNFSDSQIHSGGARPRRKVRVLDRAQTSPISQVYITDSSSCPRQARPDAEVARVGPRDTGPSFPLPTPRADLGGVGDDKLAEGRAVHEGLEPRHQQRFTAPALPHIHPAHEKKSTFVNSLSV